MGSIPSNNFPLAVDYWHDTKQEPSVLPIKTAEAGLLLARLPGSEEDLPSVHQLLYILRMNGDFPTPAQRLFERETRIVKPSLVE
jgi:hypothetical protein